MAFRVA